MKSLIPKVHGIIDRRILVNFRVAPDVLRQLLPPHFRPKLVKGWGMAGVCLIRLKNIRPRGIPSACGLSSENAAHRIAVEWDELGTVHEGVFIPRRDTSSLLQTLFGSRIFPGVHHRSKFSVTETSREYHLQMQSRDNAASVALHGRLASKIPPESLFESLAAASEFFEGGSTGYSATNTPGHYDGLELNTDCWKVEPLEILSLRSSFFDEPGRFPKGSVQFDCALLMRNISHEWHVLPRMERQL